MCPLMCPLTPNTRTKTVLMPRMDRAVWDAHKKRSFDHGLSLVQQVPEFVNFQRQQSDGSSLLMAAASRKAWQKAPHLH